MSGQPYQLNLAITGLALFQSTVKDNVEGLDCYLLPHKGHRRVLGFRAIDVRTGSGLGLEKSIAVDVFGEELVSKELGKPTSSISFAFEPLQNAPTPPTPPKMSVDLAGIPTKTELGLKTLNSQKLKGCNRITLPEGSMVRTGDFILDADGAPIRWAFALGSTTPTPSAAERPLSNHVLCSVTIPFDHFVSVTVGNETFRLSPPGLGPVFASISNLPTEIDFSAPRSKAMHMAKFGDLYSVQRSKVKIPQIKKSAGFAIKQSGICPPLNGR